MFDCVLRLRNLLGSNALRTAGTGLIIRTVALQRGPEEACRGGRGSRAKEKEQEGQALMWQRCSVIFFAGMLLLNNRPGCSGSDADEGCCAIPLPHCSNGAAQTSMSWTWGPQLLYVEGPGCLCHIVHTVKDGWMPLWCCWLFLVT